jgi:hypothetical protein
LKFAVALALAATSAAWGHERRAVKIEVPFTVKANLVVLKMTLAGKPGTFLLDTGAQGTMLDREFAGFAKKKRTGEFGVIDVEYSSVDKLCFEGGACFPKTRVGVAELGNVAGLPLHLDGIIGQDLLRGFDEVSIDYKRGIVTLAIKGDDNAGIR